MDSGATRATRGFAAPPDPREPLRVLGCAINGAADELALMMLAHLVDDLSDLRRDRPARVCRPRSWSRSSRRKASRSFASPISRPARRRRRAIWSRGSTPRCLTYGFWWALGTTRAGRREHATAARCRRGARGLDARGDPDVPGRARGDRRESPPRRSCAAANRQFVAIRQQGSLNPPISQSPNGQATPPSC